jgi:hypothetical protein
MVGACYFYMAKEYGIQKMAPADFGNWLRDLSCG